ncbi:hypothetical protein AVEN_61868-1 [Araneus ventricosus]|uniref:Uncharacterized protein n=1 Tax=Araneus ventricosus TaxID=182803 RepID=A0A4Y2UGY7_ARAVE|nr:hypothetical protein AVEN_61868-1 [Araneus ventricosus]
MNPVGRFRRGLPADSDSTDFMKIISKEVFEKLPQIPNQLMHLPPYDSAVPSSRKRPRAMLDCTYENFPPIKRRRDVSAVDDP